MHRNCNILIHRNNGFARRWPEFLEKHGFTFTVVDAHDPAVFASLLQADFLLWSLNHEDKADYDFALSLLLALNKSGVKTFPNIETRWHFDDKAAQAFFLESIGAPAAKTWIYTTKTAAGSFLDTANYPVVFKLKRGAGAQNVRLLYSKQKAKKFVNRMFSIGMKAYPSGSTLHRGIKKGFSKASVKKDALWVRGKRAANLYLTKLINNEREQGYVLFQEFLAENTHDTRVTIIGERAFVFNRYNRENDFRASGSGKLEYLTPAEIPMDMVNIAFEISQSQNFQTMAYDFVRDPKTGAAKILEMCYTFKPDAVANCLGYLTPAGNWVEGNFHPEELILIDLLGIDA